MRLPEGLIGRLAGIPNCSDAQIAAAASKSGAAEMASPSCPAASEVGEVQVAAGAGPDPYHVSGRAYLAGPYKGAPISLAIVTPAIAGPFDLGTVVVRAPLQVNPETTQIHAVSDEIPTILQGIPLDLRSITVTLSRPQFTLNPTSCNEMSFTGSAVSTLGIAASLSQRFQVANCGALPFGPKLALNLKGGTKHTGHPALRAVVSAGPGQANIAMTQVTLPHTELLDQAHLHNICTQVQFAANQCPAASVYGHARAVTPLLEQPLEGPVYLRSSSHNLPDLAVALNGRINVVLDARIDAVNGSLRTTFESLPDAPISSFVLEMEGGQKGLLENSTNICARAKANRATILMNGQNGKTYDSEPALKVRCRKRHHRNKKTPHHKRTAPRQLRAVR
jgi:hypothetical protein